MKSTYSVKQAANELSVTTQAVHIAIKQKRLRANKKAGNWYISCHDLIDFVRNKYSREHLTHNDKLVYNYADGLMSPAQIAKALELSVTNIYYHIYRKNLPAKQNGCAWVINLNDAKKYFQGV